MQALTKLNPTDPVRFDSMNAILGEIEGRDNELAKQLNVLESIAYTSKTDYFTQGETVLDFATKNSNSTKFVVSSGGNPSDLPIKKEGWVTVITDKPSSSRKRVVFKPYLGGQYEYYREIFNGAWRTEWQQIATTTNVSVTLLNGWRLHNGTLVLTRVGNMCFISMNIKGGSLNASTPIFKIPSGFVPSESIPILGTHENSKVVEIFVADVSGVFRSSGAGISESTTQIIINASWRCA